MRGLRRALLPGDRSGDRFSSRGERSFGRPYNNRYEDGDGSRGERGFSRERFQDRPARFERDGERRDFGDRPRFGGKPGFKRFGGAVTRNNTPANFEAALRMAKDYVDAHPNQPKLVTVNSWNEWTETSYLEPDDLYGYGYLEAVKRVFGE